MPVWLGIIVALIAIVTFLGSVVIYARGSKDAGTILTLERSNKALDERVKLLEASEERHIEREAGLEARVETLEKDKALLLAQRPSADVILDIYTRLTAYVEEQKDHNGEVRALLMAMAQDLGGKT